MHPLDFLASLFQSGRPQDPAQNAPGAASTGPMDWLNQFHNLLANHSGGFLTPTSMYDNNPANGPQGYNINDIAKQAQKIADAQTKKSK